jgi:hypothetical protein
MSHGLLGSHGMLFTESLDMFLQVGRSLGVRVWTAASAGRQEGAGKVPLLRREGALLVSACPELLASLAWAAAVAASRLHITGLKPGCLGSGLGSLLLLEGPRVLQLQMLETTGTACCSQLLPLLASPTAWAVPSAPFEYRILLGASSLTIALY